MNQSKMNTFFNTYIKNNFSFYVVLTLLTFCYIVFKDFLLFDKVYLFKDIGSDSINSYYPWLASKSDYLKSESIFKWTFQQGMGQNMYPFAFNEIFSVFVSYFDKNTIPYLLVYMEVVKIILIGFVFYKILLQYQLSKNVSLLASILFSACGFVIVGSCWTIFTVEALCFVIIIYGFERWLQHNKILWFVFGFIMLGCLQPFFLFMHCIILGFYLLLRYNDVKEFHLKSFIVFVIKTGALIILGVLITSFQLLPDLLQYSESPRVGGESSLFSRLMNQPIFSLLSEPLRATSIFRTFSSDMLGTGSNFRGWQNYLEAPNFYCGILSLILFPQVFGFLSKKQKYFYGAITLFLVLTILFPFFRYTFWAFTGDYYRTLSLMIAFFMVLFTAISLDKIQTHKKINLVVLAITVIVLLILLYTPHKQIKPFINTTLRDTVTGLIFIYTALIYFYAKPNQNTSLIYKGLLLLCFIEVCYFSHITVNKRDVITKQDMTTKVGYNDYSVDAINYIKANDKEFFRINKEYPSGLAIHGSINDAQVQNFYGINSYNSFNQKNYIKFLADLDVINSKDENSTRWATGISSRPILFSLVAGKYVLTKRLDNTYKMMGYDSITKFNDVIVYKNNFAFPFGFTYEQYVPHTEFKQLPTATKDFCLLTHCVVDIEDTDKVKDLRLYKPADLNIEYNFNNYFALASMAKNKSNFIITKFSENKILGNVTTNKPNMLCLSIPFDEGWSATNNGQSVKLLRVNCGLTGLITNAGNNQIELTFTPRYMKIGLMLTLISLGIFIALQTWWYITNKKITS